MLLTRLPRHISNYIAIQCPLHSRAVLSPHLAVKAKFYYAIQLASSHKPAGEPARELVADQLLPSRVADQIANLVADRFELSRHVEIARTCLRQACDQVCDLDSVMEFNPAGRRPACEPASELDNVIEFVKFHYAIQLAS